MLTEFGLWNVGRCLGKNFSQRAFCNLFALRYCQCFFASVFLTTEFYVTSFLTVNNKTKQNHSTIISNVEIIGVVSSDIIKIG